MSANPLSPSAPRCIRCGRQGVVDTPRQSCARCSSGRRARVPLLLVETHRRCYGCRGRGRVNGLVCLYCSGSGAVPRAPRKDS